MGGSPMGRIFDIVDEMDNEILKATGKKPSEYDLEGLFNESQANLKTMYGGGEGNTLEQGWLEGIKAREAEIIEKRTKLLEETAEVEELDDLGKDGIFIRKGAA